MDNTQPTVGLTLQQLQAKGAQPASQQAQKGLTLQEIIAQQQQSKPAPQQNDLLNNPITRGIQSVFPGKQVGQAIGTLGGLAIEKAKGLVGGQDNSKTYDTSAPSPLQVAGDVAQGALTVAAPNVGTGATALGRIGANAALGAGLGGAGAIAEGKSVGDIAKSTALGGVIGGGASAITEGVSKLAENLPNWFAKSALPKAKDGTIDYALGPNVKIGSTKTLLSNSDNAVNSYSSQIKGVLSHPQYANETGNVENIIPNIQNNFPNAGLEDSKIISIVKNVAKNNSTLVDKVANGTATLGEQNLLRQELDRAVYPKFTDTPSLTFNKQVGKSFADSLRGNVQTTAPETAPIFKEFAKELDLNKVLTKIDTNNNLKPTWKDYTSAAAGFQAGGVKGAMEAVLAERLLGSNAVRLATGKAIKGVAGTVGPVLNSAIQGSKSTLINKVTK